MSMQSVAKADHAALGKAGKATQELIKMVADMEAIVAHEGRPTPDAEGALSAIKAQAKLIDELVRD